MTDRLAELETWCGRLEIDSTEAEHEIARGARAILHSIQSAPASSYRDLAVCKLTDAVIIAAVASKQPPNT